MGTSTHAGHQKRLRQRPQIFPHQLLHGSSHSPPGESVGLQLLQMLETGSRGLWQSCLGQNPGLGSGRPGGQGESQGAPEAPGQGQRENFAHFSPTATQKAPVSPQINGSRMTPPKSYSPQIQGFPALDFPAFLHTHCPLSGATGKLLELIEKF